MRSGPCPPQNRADCAIMDLESSLESSLLGGTSNGYATLAANGAFFGGSTALAGLREWRGDSCRRAGCARRRDDAFAARLGHRRAQAFGRDRDPQRAARTPLRTA